MSRVFLTFSDSRLQRSVRRIAGQAKKLAFYDKIICASEADLELEFVERFKERLVPGSRGYGYWCWKPQIILQALSEMADGDVVQYTDAGCHLNQAGQKRLNDYFEMAASSTTGLVVFQAKPPVFPLEHDGRPLLDLREFKWTKADLLDYFSVLNDEAVLSSQQIGAGVVFVRKCEQSVAILKEWLKVYQDRFALADDSPSVIENLAGFVEHRHDQSIISVLCKKHKVSTISAYEYWYPLPGKVKPDWRALREFPVHARRDRGLDVVARASLFLKILLRKIRNPRPKPMITFVE